MTDQIVGLEVARLAKEKGFNIVTDRMYATTGQLEPFNNTRWSLYRDYYYAATQSLLAKWLREQYIFIIIKKEIIGSDEWVWAYRIEYLPADKQDAKRRCPYFLEKESYNESPGGTYWGGWDTYEEALEEALKYSLGLL